MKKVCNRCREEKPASAFGKKPKGKLQAYCKPCQIAYRKEHYAKNKEVYMASALRRKKRVWAAVDQMKAKPCADCGHQYPPYVMDFDHREGEEKTHQISVMRARALGMSNILKEVAKCDVVCSNCHRIRTHNRRTRD